MVVSKLQSKPDRMTQRISASAISHQQLLAEESPLDTPGGLEAVNGSLWGYKTHTMTLIPRRLNIQSFNN